MKCTGPSCLDNRLLTSLALPGRARLLDYENDDDYDDYDDDDVLLMTCC